MCMDVNRHFCEYVVCHRHVDDRCVAHLCSSGRFSSVAVFCPHFMAWRSGRAPLGWVFVEHAARIALPLIALS